MEPIVVTRRTALTTARLSFSAAVAVIVPLALVTGCPEQPPMKCAIERSASNLGFQGFAAQYTLTSGSGTCSELLGDVIGVQQFHPNDHGKPDFSEGTVALQASALGNVAFGGDPNAGGAADPNPDHKVYAIGKYTSMEPSGGFCSVPTLAPAELDLPEIPPEVVEGGLADGGDGGPLADAATDGAVSDAAADGAVSDAGDDGAAQEAGATDAGACTPPAEPPPAPFPGQAAMSFRYEWSNLRVRMTKDFPGNAFSADLTVTQDGCTASYQVNAVFPAAFCADTPVPAGDPADPSAPCDDACNPCSTGVCAGGSCARACSTASDCPKDAQCTGGACIAPADFFCKSTPRPDLGIPVPSGIASNMPVKCDANLGMCVLTKPVSQL